jgi:hypothetical protein
VYYILPRPTPPNTELVRSAPGVEGITMGPAPAPAADLPSGGTILTGRGDPDPEHRPRLGADASSRLALGPEIPSARDLGVSNAIDPADQMISNVLSRTGAVGTSETVVVVLDAPDPFTAQTQVSQFLTDHRIEFEVHAHDAPLPEPLALKESQVGLGSRAQQINVRMKQSPADPTEKNLQSGAELLTKDDDGRAGVGSDAASSDDGVGRQSKQRRNKYLARGMTRQDVETLCQQFSEDPDQQPGLFDQAEQILRELRAMIPVASSAPRNGTESAEGSIPGQADTFELKHPTTQPASIVDNAFKLGAAVNLDPPNDLVDVLIVVRADSDATETPEASLRRADQPPSTSPATAAPSPD